jgi:hypothetical protein
MDVETGKASGIESDNLTFFTSWRIATKVLDKYETVCSFPSENKNGKSVGSSVLVADKRGMPTEGAELKKVSSWMQDSDIEKAAGRHSPA